MDYHAKANLATMAALVSIFPIMLYARFLQELMLTKKWLTGNPRKSMDCVESGNYTYKNNM